MNIKIKNYLIIYYSYKITVKQFLKTNTVFSKIGRDKKRVLKIEGDRRVNRLIYYHWNNFNIKIDNLSKIQRRIIGVILRDKKVLKWFIKHDLYGLVELEKSLGICGRYKYNTVLFKKTNKNPIDDFRKEYKQLIKNIKKENFGKIYKNNIFYNEIRLVNEYTVSLLNLKYFDYNLFDISYDTKSELLIYDLIREKMDEYNYGIHFN